MPDESQLVYTTVAPRSAPRPCSALPAEAVGGALAVSVAPRFPRVMFAAVAQYDECEEPVPDGYVPVRVGGRRGRVIAAPLHDIRPVD